jgi:aryl-alcohol dehydrogenase-like predicted oxidoreductase
MKAAAIMNPRSLPGFSRLGLGTGLLASWKNGLSPAAADRLLGVAKDEGITLIDTADSYAAGECERLLGRLMKNHKDQFHVMTKAGYVSADLPGPLRRFNPLVKKLRHKLGSRQDFRPKEIGNCLRRSLERLNVDHVSVFLLHDPPADVLRDGALFAEMGRLKKAGLAEHLGVSSGDDEVLRMALDWNECEVIQTPLVQVGGLAAALRQAGPRRPAIVLNHVSLGGRLPGAGDDADPEVRAWQEKVALRAAEIGTSPYAALLRVALEETGAEAVLTGTRHAGHLGENCRAVMNGLTPPNSDSKP